MLYLCIVNNKHKQQKQSKMENTISRLGRTYDMNSLADLKDLLAKDEEFIRISDGRSKLVKALKKEAKWLDMRIFKMENPEMFDNYRQALADYCQHSIRFENN